MTANELKDQIVQDVVAHGFTLPAQLLDLNLSTLIHLAKLEAVQAIETAAIGQHITEPIEAMYKCVYLGQNNYDVGLTLGKSYKVHGNSFYDNHGHHRVQVADIYLDMENPIYPEPIDAVTDPQL